MSFAASCARLYDQLRAIELLGTCNPETHFPLNARGERLITYLRLRRFR